MMWNSNGKFVGSLSTALNLNGGSVSVSFSCVLNWISEVRERLTAKPLWSIEEPLDVAESLKQWFHSITQWEKLDGLFYRRSLTFICGFFFTMIFISVVPVFFKLYSQFPQSLAYIHTYYNIHTYNLSFKDVHNFYYEWGIVLFPFQ